MFLVYDPFLWCGVQSKTNWRFLIEKWLNYTNITFHLLIFIYGPSPLNDRWCMTISYSDINIHIKIPSLPCGRWLFQSSIITVLFSFRRLIYQLPYLLVICDDMPPWSRLDFLETELVKFKLTQPIPISKSRINIIL